MTVRATLVLLVLLNFGYFLWHMMLSGDEASVGRSLSSPSLNTVQLLDEAIASGLAVKYEQANQADVKADLKLCTQIGFFDTRESAQMVRHRLMAVSIRSTLEKEKITTDVFRYWIELDGTNSLLLGEPLWLSLKIRYPALEKVSKLCDESIASHSRLS